MLRILPGHPTAVSSASPATRTVATSKSTIPTHQSTASASTAPTRQRGGRGLGIGALLPELRVPRDHHRRPGQLLPADRQPHSTRHRRARRGRPASLRLCKPTATPNATGVDHLLSAFPLYAEFGAGPARLADSLAVRLHRGPRKPNRLLLAVPRSQRALVRWLHGPTIDRRVLPQGQDQQRRARPGPPG